MNKKEVVASVVYIAKVSDLIPLMAEIKFTIILMNTHFSEILHVMKNVVRNSFINFM